jgi:hypothetical protein
VYCLVTFVAEGKTEIKIGNGREVMQQGKKEKYK